MRTILLRLALAFTLMMSVACQRTVAGSDAKVEQSEAPVLGGGEEAGQQLDTGAALGGGQQAASVSEAAPPGLRIVNMKISPTTLGIIQSTGFKGFRSGDNSSLIQLPLYGLDPRLNIYYLVVAVGNFGSAPVRNLKGRAEFFDAKGVKVWSETQAITHLPTRLGLNPPSLPNVLEPQAELGAELRGFGIYYFPTNVGAFTFSVPDSAVSATIKSWKLVFLVSTT